jgi:hypothetical protein
MQFPNLKAPIQELFGTQNGSAIFDLPCRISYLVTALPPGHQYSVEYFIDNCTLLPFLSPFLPLGRVPQILEKMKGTGGPLTYLRSGLMASRIPTPQWLRFCPLCRDDDKKLYGETYWRRLYQVQGVVVCPFHNVLLENGFTRRGYSRCFLQFISAEGSTKEGTVRGLDTSDRDKQILLKIARDVSWLLTHPCYESEVAALNSRYRRLLTERGLVSYGGAVQVSKLLDAFTEFCSPALLKSLHCEFRGKDQIHTNWLLRLVRRPRHAQHPLYHLLLMQFLGYTAEELFSLPTESRLFGDGPWPCLNPAATHYRKSVIKEYKLSPQLRRRKPVGRFSCKCGFAYARTGPDSSPEDKFRIDKMLSFGSLWEATLMELWKDQSLSVKEMGRRLKVDTLTLRRYATKLELPFLRFGKMVKPVRPAKQLKGPYHQEPVRDKRSKYRSSWLTEMRYNQTASWIELRQALPREYQWLIKNDSTWLKKHRILPPKRSGPPSSIDWKARDAFYAVAVREAALRLKNAPGRPAQVTKTAIGIELGAVGILRQKIQRMPITAQVLANVIETQEQYAARRIWWAANSYYEEDTFPKAWQLVKRASVNQLKARPEVRYTIEAAMHMIKTRLTREQELQAVS